MSGSPPISSRSGRRSPLPGARPRPDGLFGTARRAIRFPWEDQAAAQTHVRAAIAERLREQPANVIVVDYLLTLLFLPPAPPETATVLISLNREAAFMREQIDLGYTPNGRIAAEIAWWRLRQFESQANERADQSVFLSLMDLPRGHLPAPARSLTPHLNPVSDGWYPAGRRSTFFVGNFGHHPNRFVIEWLVRDLAPNLWRLAPDISIHMIGATAGDVATSRPPSPNLVFLGAGDDGLAAEMFPTCDLALCPVSNDFGLKFKALDALAYGTPLLASPATLRGLPHLHGSSTRDLTQPDWSAEVIRSLIDSPERLAALQSRQQTRQSQFVASQAKAWSDVLKSAIAARRNR
jgi:hypothetical protein